MGKINCNRLALLPDEHCLKIETAGNSESLGNRLKCRSTAERRIRMRIQSSNTCVLVVSIIHKGIVVHPPRSLVCCSSPSCSPARMPGAGAP
jgi:hypothetical protein